MEVIDCLIMSYSPKDISLHRSKNGIDTIKGSWLFELAKKYSGYGDLDNKIFFIGRDSKNRIEIGVKPNLFQELKNDPVFIMKAENLRRLRSSKSWSLLGSLCYQVAYFDNDLDLKP